MKYLLCALLLCGAFFSQFSYSDDTKQLLCLDVGGTYSNRPDLGEICWAPAPQGSAFMCSSPLNDPVRVNSWTQCEDIVRPLVNNPCFESGPISIIRSQTRRYVGWQGVTKPSGGVTCQNGVEVVLTETNSEYFCPPEDKPQLATLLLGENICYAPAPTDEPPCDDILNNCEEPPPCVPGGNGMMVCRDNPEDKCWTDAIGETFCEEGCGWINDQFFCTIPGDDMPDFEECKFTINGYACPSEPIDDEIENPEKPIDDMVKGDFKEVNKGVENRQNVTNELLKTQLSEWAKQSDKTQGAINDMNQNLGGKLNTANGHLESIDDTLKKVGDFLEPGDEINPPPQEPESWYESEYEDGIKGVWEEKSSAVMNTPIFQFVEQFKFQPSGAQPDWQICFNLGRLGDYGCKNIEIPQGVWAFLRIVILITAAFLCRAAVTGV